MHAFQSLLGAQKYDDMVKIMTDEFGKEFLEKNEGHPIQQLWQRDDFIAGVELYYFSQCISNLLHDNRKWVREMVKSLSENVDAFRGDAFEIIALGMLSDPANKVTAMTLNNPGVDGVVEFANKKQIRFSIKNFNLSAHHTSFNKYSKEIEEIFVTRLKDFGAPHCFITIRGNVDRLLQHHWALLFDNLEELVMCYTFDGSVDRQISDSWHVKISPLVAEGQDPISNKAFSYTFVISAPQHPNENQNLIGKIESGIANLEKHGGDESDDVLNFIFIQLPPSVPFNQNITWAKDYLDTHPQIKVSGIMFYLPFFYNDAKEGTCYLINSLKFVTTEKYARLGFGKGVFPVDFPAGRQISDPPVKRYGDSANGLSPEDGLYIYQSGVHSYSVPIIKRDPESVTLELNLTMPDFGITRYNIIEVDDNNGVKLETMLHPPGDRLLVL